MPLGFLWSFPHAIFCASSHITQANFRIYCAIKIVTGASGMAQWVDTVVAKPEPGIDLQNTQWEEDL